MPIDLRQPFRGTDAVASGLVTPKALRGPRFRRLFTGIYVRADVEVAFEVRSRAAYLLLDGNGVLGGFSAAGVRPHLGSIKRIDRFQTARIARARALSSISERSALAGLTTAVRVAFTCSS